jgi:hypothetical protein
MNILSETAIVVSSGTTDTSAKGILVILMKIA